MVTITKYDLIELGYGTSQSASIIRLAKCLMVEKGFAYYCSKRLARVPVAAVEEILGINLEIEEKIHA